MPFIVTRIERAIYLEFENGKHGIVDFSSYLNRGKVFQRFTDLKYFQDFHIDHGTLCWKDELDIAPDMLYVKATGEGIPVENVEEGEFAFFRRLD